MIILTRRNISPSARALRDRLEDYLEETVYIRTASPNSRRSDQQVVRWGNSSAIEVGVDLDLNPARLIRACANKALFVDTLKKGSTPFVDLVRGRPDSFPVAVRTTLHGMRGQGLVICENDEQFAPISHHYWSQWYKFSFELGVHLLGGEPVKILRKVSPSPVEPRFPIRNSDHNYHFRRVAGEKYPKLHPILDSFYKDFPIKFGRLDIGWDSTNGVYRAIEFNSAPSLIENEDTLDLYSEFLADEVRSY